MALWPAPPATARDISSNAGTSTAQYLKLEMGARHSGMGGTYAGYGTDVFSLWGQPAAIAAAPSAWQVGFQHTEWFQGIQQEYVGLSGRLGGRGRWGLVANTLGVDDLLRASENTAGQLTGSGGTFEARDWGISLHYGLPWTDYLSVGGAVRYLSSEIDNVRAQSWAVDLGARWQVPAVDGLTIGGSVTNLGPGLKYIRLRDDLPTTGRIGGAYDLSVKMHLPVLLAVDAVKARDRDWDAGVGVEWRALDMLRLRAGYRSQGDDVGQGVTGGLGLKFGGLELDYSYVPFGDLGEAHRVSAGYLFGGGGVVEASSSKPRTPATARPPAGSKMQKTSSAKSKAKAGKSPKPLRKKL